VWIAVLYAHVILCTHCQHVHTVRPAINSPAASFQHDHPLLVHPPLATAVSHRCATSTEVATSHIQPGAVCHLPLAAGEVVVCYEEQPHVLVTLDHVKRTWPPSSDAARWFDPYAWPVSDSVWVTLEC
jgi:hypothetical protein